MASVDLNRPVGSHLEKCLAGEMLFDEDFEELPGGIKLFPGVKARNALDLKENLAARSSDIFVTSDLRNGTNWIMYIVLLIANDGAPPERDLDSIAPCIDFMKLSEVEVSIAQIYNLFIHFYRQWNLHVI